ncbi:type VI secretion system membrane subunit TssM [Caldimonas thermodepolymerans]|uniref:Type VI secretion system protein ImpL n=1 Tax=Caldimonas thermodepolymerans TaxID=215580 RepID=A0AA46DH49_9BURK|nr:type VI secretion system membrane subunit TssM [Caldimonas thermodepolymerans]TCP09767.1 type VI secretion system protein ImpL [Caldimonas thermodepolymerans]UZG49776.1 type VI secretion system membrane subunit TssM [Caldimonas thermodepolymerans]
MKKLFGWIFNRWVMLALGLLALAAVIWIVGPLLAIGAWHPLEGTLARVALIVLVALSVVGKQAWTAWRARKASERLVQGFAQQAAQAPAPSAGAQEVEVIAGRFKEALETLRKSRLAGQAGRFGRGYLYHLPWYVIIGAPGSGKTTALINSGLEFPLADRFGKEAIRGVGGTRNCDWWFTNEAILLDTAGRYTTQDSSQQDDATAWTGFLQLLRRHRPRRPINGVLVTISVPDMLSHPAPERERYAQTVRQRVQELYQQLGVRIPVYLLVTKTDLLPGFIEYFDHLGKEERQQVLGFTLPYQDQAPALEKEALGTTFESEFALLSKRLFEGSLERLEAERDPQRRALVYSFPQQFTALREVLGEFLVNAFAASKFDQPILLRGVYFTSGTQEDSPIDRIMGVLARSFKVERRALPPQKSTGRSYFLTHTLKGVIFQEAELAGTNLKWERRRTWLHRAAYVAIAVLGVGLLAAWGVSYVNNRQYLAAVEQRIAPAAQTVQAIDPGTGADVLQLLPALNELRRLAIVDPVRPDLSAPASMQFGLFQGDKVDAAARAAYQRLLDDAMLPKVARRIEDLLRSAQNRNPELMYEALKAYVMLYDSEHYSAADLKDLVLADWETTLPREVGNEQRAELEAHLDVLLDRGVVMSPLPQDKALVEQSRAALQRMSLAQRVYNRLKRVGVGADIPEFKITKAAGPAAGLVFTRASGEPLTKGVPGLYTYDGYHKAFQAQADRVARQLFEEEGWVLGLSEQQRSATLRDAQGLARLMSDVKRLYLEDYARVWEFFINDIRLANRGTLTDTIQLVRTLSAPDSPLPPLLRAIVKETTLGEKIDGNTLERTTSTVRDRVSETRESLARLLGGDRQEPGASALPQRIESLVDDRFEALRRYVLAPAQGQPAPMDGTLQLLNELYTLMTATETAVRGGGAPPPSDVPNKVRAEAGRAPEPVRALMNQAVTAGITQALGATRDHLSNQMQANIVEFCRQAIEGRYPFARGSNRDVTQDDFARLFAPGGLLDDFFQRNLLAFVDTSTRPWRFREVGGGMMGGSRDSAALAQFQRAQAIRDTFFRAGGNQPGLRLEFKPVEMDAAITQFILDVDGQIVRYAHGPAVPTTVQWPGTGGRGQVRIQLSPPSASGSSGAVFEGPWALFRMFDRVQIEGTGQPERFRAVFSVDGRRAVFEVTTSSVLNPFRMSELSSFSCPGKL